jgi:hypothetical protein
MTKLFSLPQTLTKENFLDIFLCINTPCSSVGRRYCTSIVTELIRSFCLMREIMGRKFEKCMNKFLCTLADVLVCTHENFPSMIHHRWRTEIVDGRRSTCKKENQNFTINYA